MATSTVNVISGAAVAVPPVAPPSASLREQVASALPTTVALQSQPLPVGTAATVKAMRPEEVRATGADILLSNTYHLMLRPGAERVAKLG
ncbi:MAG TPA: hypothetical protein PLW24_03595, partial [Burkholderiaceae bacterium]|nr:hypothetical protein [Burkholderiaceae bacterium]